MPSLMQIDTCNFYLGQALISASTNCHLDIPPANVPLSPFDKLNAVVANLCENEKCYNAGIQYSKNISKHCPEDYVGDIQFKGSHILANATAWMTPVTQDIVDRQPTCTKDTKQNVFFFFVLQLIYAVLRAVPSFQSKNCKKNS